MLRIVFVAFLLLFSTPFESIAQHVYPEFTIKESETSRHIRFLASDELLGRLTGEQGNWAAARYIAEHFREYGLTDPTGSGDYYQQIPLWRDNQTGRFSNTGTSDSPEATFRKLIANNVIGIVEGTDPELKNEYILLIAHFDHIGAGLRRGITPADTIFNGARDNGMGVVGLLSAAKSLSQEPPKRSVIIMAVNAEEVGMLGSRFFVQHPVVPLQQIKFVLNVDSGGYNDTSLVTLVGYGRTTADAIIAEALQAFDLTLLPDPSPEQNLFNRSDNIHFARAGIPAPTFSPGFTAFDDELLKYYHQPNDKADDSFDFGYLNLFANSYAHTARLLANTDTELKWVHGDVFEEAYFQLHESSVQN